MSPRSSKNRIDGYFAPRLLEMLRSPAYRVLSRAAHQMLACLELELGAHDTKNGKLIVTFAQFIEYGLHNKAIAPAIRELVALGFLEVTEQGRGGNAEWRRPSKYRLTYRKADGKPPTNEWRSITREDAARTASKARRPKIISQGRKAPRTRAGNRPRKNCFFGGGKRPAPPDFSGAESALLSRSSPSPSPQGSDGAVPASEPTAPPAANGPAPTGALKLPWSIPAVTAVTSPLEANSIRLWCLVKQLKARSERGDNE